MVNIQTRKTTDDLASLVKQLDRMVDNAGEKGDATKHAFLVYLTDDPDAAEKELEEFTEKHKIKNIPLTIFDGVTGPPNYHIAKDAEVTVMMWKGQEVKVNQAFASGKLDKKAVRKLLKDAKEHLTKVEPEQAPEDDAS